MKTLLNFFVITVLIACFTISDTYSNADVSIFLKSPKTVKAGDTYRVDITINKDGLKGFSKFEAIIPDGFIITPINSNSSTFILKNSVAKFVWIEMPKNESLDISYNVKVPDNYNGESRMTGAFHYIDNDEKYSQRFCSILNILNDNFKKSLNNIEIPEMISNESIEANALVINENIDFCVQIAAFSRPVSSKILAELYKPSFRIKEIFENGLYKYYVGGFNTLQAARKFKNYCGISDAFIIAYHRNNRTTIKDAMMIIAKEK